MSTYSTRIKGGTRLTDEGSFIVYICVWNNEEAIGEPTEYVSEKFATESEARDYYMTKVRPMLTGLTVELVRLGMEVVRRPT